MSFLHWEKKTIDKEEKGEDIWVDSSQGESCQLFFTLKLVAGFHYEKQHRSLPQYSEIFFHVLCGAFMLSVR